MAKNLVHAPTKTHTPQKATPAPSPVLFPVDLGPALDKIDRGEAGQTTFMRNDRRYTIRVVSVQGVYALLIAPDHEPTAKSAKQKARNKKARRT